jgi:hypothetical protein
MREIPARLPPASEALAELAAVVPGAPNRPNDPLRIILATLSPSFQIKSDCVGWTSAHNARVLETYEAKRLF